MQASVKFCTRSDDKTRWQPTISPEDYHFRHFRSLFTQIIPNFKEAQVQYILSGKRCQVSCTIHYAQTHKGTNKHTWEQIH